MKAAKLKLTQIQLDKLKLNSFGDNTFKNSPDWIKCWASFCLD